MKPSYRKHYRDVLGTLAGLALLVTLWVLTARYLPLPGPVDLLTRPVIAWFVEPDAIPASNPATEAPAEPPASVDDLQVTSVMRARGQAANPVAEDAPPTPDTALPSNTSPAPESPPLPDVTPPSEPQQAAPALAEAAPTPTPTPAPTPPEPAPQSEESAILQDALAPVSTGFANLARDVNEDGLLLPALFIEAWRPDDVRALLRYNLGLVLAEVDGRHYRVDVSTGGLTTGEGAGFYPLTSKIVNLLSNRGLALNLYYRGGRPHATAQRDAFRPLEAAFHRKTGIDTVPTFYFYPTAAFDTYLAGEQLKALRAIGIDAHDPALQGRVLATLGRLIYPSSGSPRYVIHAIRIGDELHPLKAP